MWENYGFDDEELLQSGIKLLTGIGGRTESVCGALSAAGISLGMRYRHPGYDTRNTEQSRQEAQNKAAKLAISFSKRFGNIVCRELIGIDLNNPDISRWFWESGQWEEKCSEYINFIIEQLYESEES